MQRLTRQWKHGLVTPGPAVLDEIEKQRLVRTVNLVTGYRMPEPFRVHPDLVKPPSLRFDTNQRETFRAGKGSEYRRRRLSIRAHGTPDVNA
jgi:hypothetical protein